MSIANSIRAQIPPIHPEGYPFIGGFALASLVLFWIWGPLGWIGTLLTVWCALFFRDPVRVTPVREGLVVSPADGRVSLIAPALPPAELGLGDQPLLRISIFMELAPRDVVSRSMMMEIQEGRGFVHETGVECLKLDLTHISEDRIKERLAGIREIGIKFSGVDIVNEPIEIRPVCHYMMGGIHTDIDGRTEMDGLWAAGEAACNSTHGANRLGANSTSECLVWGKITGMLAAGYAHTHLNRTIDILNDKILLEEKRIYDGIFRGRGNVNPYEIKKELTDMMDKNAYVFRNEDGLTDGLKKARELSKLAWNHAKRTGFQNGSQNSRFTG